MRSLFDISDDSDHMGLTDEYRLATWALSDLLWKPSQQALNGDNCYCPLHRVPAPVGVPRAALSLFTTITAEIHARTPIIRDRFIGKNRFNFKSLFAENQAGLLFLLQPYLWCYLL